jgi:hypothetical protein
MKTFAAHANRPRRRQGLSQSAIRKIEIIATQGDRAFFRQFVAADRRVLRNGGLSHE